MITSLQKRWRFVLLTASVVLIFMLSTLATHQPSATPEVVQPAPHQQRQSTTAAPAKAEPLAAIPLKKIERTKSSPTTAELFKPKSWYVAPPPPPPAPPPPPTAPPLPFEFLGKVENPDGTFTIFLSGHDRVYLIKGGETIDGMYHVDGIKDGQLVLTYLPLQIQQFMTLGDAP